MPSPRKLHVYRVAERLTIIIAIVLVVLLAGISAQGMLGTHESYIGGATVVLLLLVVFFIQRKIDGLVNVLASQASYLQDDALTALFDNSPVAYLIVDTRGRVVASNAAATQLLQGDMGTMRGVHFFDLIESNDTFDPAVLEGKVQAGVTVNDVEVPVRTIAGRQLWVMLSVFAYHGSERLLTLVDMTELKQIDTAKSEFVALATHQLRTPIAAIRWNVELLEKKMRDSKTEAQERYLTKIERNVLRMLALINDFLSVSKLEMGTYAAREEDTNLTEFFSSIADEFTEKITEKQIVLSRNEDPPQLVIRTDSRLFHIIVSNLMSNAVKYLRPQGRLELSYRLEGDRLKIVVADDGIGIPAAEQEKLFTKFYRASNAQSHQTEGTGLGLYIVKQSVEQLGGTITLASAEDKGAAFTIVMPAVVVSAGGIS